MSVETLRRVCDWYARLSLENIKELRDLYAGDARFVDPFNDVRGHAAIEAVLRDMFEQLESPLFSIEQSVLQGDTAFVAWRFSFRFRGRPAGFDGVTRLVFGADGRVVEHFDYWDAARLYEQLPILGSVLRWVRQRCVAH